jgi:hypothetical protein
VPRAHGRLATMIPPGRTGVWLVWQAACGPCFVFCGWQSPGWRGRVAGVPRARVSFLGCRDGLVLVRGPDPHFAGARRQQRGRPTSPGPIDGAPLPPGSAPPRLEPLVHQALGSTREELGGTQPPWGRLRTGGAPPARPAGCPDSIPIGPLGA